MWKGTAHSEAQPNLFTAFQQAFPIESVLFFHCSSIFVHPEKRRTSIQMVEVQPRGAVQSKELVRILPGAGRKLPLEPGSSDRTPDRSLD
jgi:hypothetical protein